MRITTDIEDLDRMAPPPWTVRVHSAQKCPAMWKRLALLARDAVRSDYLVIHFEFVPVLVLGLFLPFTRCRLVTLDFFIPVLKRWMKPLVGVALRRVFRLLVYFRNPDVFVHRYGIDPADMDGPVVVEAIARRRGCLRRTRQGTVPDLEKAALILLTDYRNGALGRISLETPESRAVMLAGSVAGESGGSL